VIDVRNDDRHARLVGEGEHGFALLAPDLVLNFRLQPCPLAEGLLDFVALGPGLRPSLLRSADTVGRNPGLCVARLGRVREKLGADRTRALDAVVLAAFDPSRDNVVRDCDAVY
jgi:hypothetical protein